jgi:hypothetical protein
VLAKWLLLLAIIPCVGIGGINQIFASIDKVEQYGFQGGFCYPHMRIPPICWKEWNAMSGYMKPLAS